MCIMENFPCTKQVKGKYVESAGQRNGQPLGQQTHQTTITSRSPNKNRYYAPPSKPNPGVNPTHQRCPSQPLPLLSRRSTHRRHDPIPLLQNRRRLPPQDRAPTRLLVERGARAGRGGARGDGGAFVSGGVLEGGGGGDPEGAVWEDGGDDPHCDVWWHEVAGDVSECSVCVMLFVCLFIYGIAVAS